MPTPLRMPGEVHVQGEVPLGDHLQQREKPARRLAVRRVQVGEARRQRRIELGQIEVADHGDHLPARVHHLDQLVEIGRPERLHAAALLDQPPRVLGGAVVGDAVGREMDGADHEVHAVGLEELCPVPLHAQAGPQPLQLHPAAHLDAAGELFPQALHAGGKIEIGGVPADELHRRWRARVA